MLRWMDDYLYVTTVKPNAISFLRVMNQGMEATLRSNISSLQLSRRPSGIRLFHQQRENLDQFLV